MEGKAPSVGTYSESLLADVRSKGAPQMGSVTFSPQEITAEFIYKDHSGNLVLTVTVNSPERIVYMPVPEWVIETIWQGDISGSYHFESDALRLLDGLKESIEPSNNAALFGKQSPKRRE